MLIVRLAKVLPIIVSHAETCCRNFMIINAMKNVLKKLMMNPMFARIVTNHVKAVLLVQINLACLAPKMAHLTCTTTNAWYNVLLIPSQKTLNVLTVRVHV